MIFLIFRYILKIAIMSHQILGIEGLFLLVTRQLAMV